LEISKRSRKSDPYSVVFDEGKTSIHKTYLLFAAATALLTSLAVILAYYRFDLPTRTSQLITLAARLAWGGSLIGIFWCFFLAIKKLSFRPFEIGKPDTFWGLSGAWLVVLLLTFAMVLALFPDHIFNRLILPTLFERFITLDSNTNILATTFVSAKLYLGLLLLKSGLPFGIATFASLGWALRKSIQQKWLLLLAVVLISYGLMLAVLPLQQPFWLISIYPSLCFC
jgi:hypothetical protein